MAGRVNSGLSGGLGGFQGLRRSGRTRKPKVDNSFISFITTPRSSRGKNAGKGPGPAGTSSTGAPRRQQGARNRTSVRHSSSSESDDDSEQDGDDENDNSEKI